MPNLKDFTDQIIRFRNLRDWKQFHNPKDIALSLILEAAEVGEHFQWKNDAEMEEHARSNRDAIGEELADVLYWVLLLSHDLQIDLPTAFLRKMEKNEKKYPIAKAKGKHTKYTKL